MALPNTPDPPQIPVFYTLTKIHKPTPVGRPIISGCSGPTERISAFVDHFIQPTAQLEASYLKDTTDLASSRGFNCHTCFNGRHKPIGGFHAISGDINNNGEMNKCLWTNKAS